MNDGPDTPDDDGPGIAFFGTHLVNNPAGEQHGNRIRKLESRSDIGILAIGPSELIHQYWF